MTMPVIVPVTKGNTAKYVLVKNVIVADHDKVPETPL